MSEKKMWGLPGVDHFADGEMSQAEIGCHSVRVDSRDNSSLDPFLLTLSTELGKSGLKLGDHIKMGFADDEQADGWYIEEA